MLYCRLTRASVNNVRSDVEKHCDGRKFTRKVYQNWKRAMLKRKRLLLKQIKGEDANRAKLGKTSTGIYLLSNR